MSKKKDRLNSDYRFCPICGRKTIHVAIKKRFCKEKTYIECRYCWRTVMIRG